LTSHWPPVTLVRFRERGAPNLGFDISDGSRLPRRLSLDAVAAVRAAGSALSVMSGTGSHNGVVAPKKRKQGLLDDMVDAFALTSWWVPATVTILVFVLFSAINWPLPWLWAGIVLLTGVIGQLTRLERRGLVAKTKTIDHLKTLSWDRFEQLVAEAYRQLGYSVGETSAGADGGVDLVLRRDGETTYVQCKQWRQRQVGVRPVRELYGCMADGRAQHGVLLCSGSYTGDAVRWAQGKRLALIDGQGVLDLLGGRSAAQAQVVAWSEPAATPEPQVCPRCGLPMVLRTARNGRNAGGQFWGCSRFPDCRGIVKIA
jgi:restriction system protein